LPLFNSKLKTQNSCDRPFFLRYNKKFCGTVDNRKIMAKRIQLVLNKDVSKLGRAGDLVEVAPGYARNYLIPQGAAVNVTPGILKQVERRREKERQRLAELKEQSLVQKAALEKVGALAIAKQAGEKDAIFGTVTNQDVADAIKAATGQDLDRRGITLPEIHKLGEYRAEIKLHPEVSATVTIQVVAS
jgi:large subunit ribosomal protein L9